MTPLSTPTGMCATGKLVHLTIPSKIKRLSDILLETECRGQRSRNVILPKKDIYHLPSSQTKVTILGSCKRVKKYPFRERYWARRELKELYKELSDGEEKDEVRTLLLKTGIYSWFRKNMSFSS